MGGSVFAALLLSAFPHLSSAIWGASVCGDEASCQAKFSSLADKLNANHRTLKERQTTLRALEDMRAGVVAGKTLELPSAQRAYLAEASPAVGEVSVDVRHRPLSTNFSKHFAELRTIAPQSSIRLHSFMPLKRSSASSKGAPLALVVALDQNSLLSIFSQDGEALLDAFDLGHAGSMVTHVALSPSQDKHFVVSGDDLGNLRVHDLKVVAKREIKGGKDEGEDEKGHAKAAQQLLVSAHLSAEFSLPEGGRRLNALLTVDEKSDSLVVTGDSHGAISVWYRNGTFRGTVKVTEVEGGVAGLVRVPGNAIVFYTKHSFGYFSPSHLELPGPPCGGWKSPVVDVVLEPGTNRALVSLEDGNVLVFAASADKQKSCELAFKFPRVTTTPFKLHSLKGHIVGLPLSAPTGKQESIVKDLHFFHVAAMEKGFGAGPSRALALQVNFEDRVPEAISISVSGEATAPKSLMAVRFVGMTGLHLFEVTLKKPVLPRIDQGGFMGELADWLTWMPEWVPKVAVFGFALVAVVMWNMRKLNKGKKAAKPGGMDDFDNEQFKELLRERRAKRDAEKATAAKEAGSSETQ